MSAKRKSYAEKLKDPRWQKKRLELLTAANWKCQCSHCQNEQDSPTLHVHHRLYLRETEPWEYPDWAYSVLCEECHAVEQRMMERVHSVVAKSEAAFHLVLDLANLSDEELQQFCDDSFDLYLGNPALRPATLKAFSSFASIMRGTVNAGLKLGKQKSE